ncbi:uncharacterized protein [Hetaerina americana]|uniref:uncharacterized protein n=1 Tax=Hetaerina americana TaxID=62018 RepID=UPI003A7F1B58
MRPERTVAILCWWVATLAAQDSDATGHRGPPPGDPLVINSTASADILPSSSFLDSAPRYGHDVLEQDIAAVFNRVASGSATSTVDYPPPNTTPRTSSTRQAYTTTSTTTRRTPPPPATENLKTSTLAPPPPAGLPEYVPLARRPPPNQEFPNTFSAILRSSSADSSHGPPGTPRTAPPPLPPPLESARIPEKPQPDFITPRKKPLNTPAILPPSRATYSPHMTYSDGPSTLPPFGGIEGSIRNGNDTEINIVPILQNPSITRILSGSNGSVRRPGEEAALAGIGAGIRGLPVPPIDGISRDSVARMEPEPRENTKSEPIPEERPRVADVVAAPPQPLPPPPPPPRPAVPPQTTVEETSPPPEKIPDVHPGRASTQRAWGLAWDIHVYLAGTLFALLAFRSLIELIILPTVPPLLLLLPRGYSIALNALLLLIGILRSVYLLHDAYNVRHSYPPTLSYLLLDAAFPCLATAFAVLFLSLLRSTGVRLPVARLQTPAALALIAVLYLALCVGVDVTVGSMPISDSLLLICQGVAVLWSVALSLAYLYAFGAMSRLAAAAFTTGTARRGGSGQSMVSNRGKVVVPLPERPKAVASAVRITLGTALLGLLMAAVLIYGMFGVHGIIMRAGHSNRIHPWPWWGYHFSLRVIEISMCLLMSFVGTLRVGRKMNEGKESGDGWPLVSYLTCSCCVSSPPPEVNVNEDESVDESYPAVCGVNQTVGKFSLGRSTGKNVYDDSYAMPPHSGGDSMPSTTPSGSIGPAEGQHVGGRMSGMTTLTNPSERHSNTTGHNHSRSHCPGSRSGSLTLGSTRSCPSSSMLFAENGFVRFRTSADPEQPMEEVLQQSARKGCQPLPSTVLPKPYDDDEISYKSIDEEVKEEDSKHSRSMLIGHHRHAPVPDVAEVHLERGLASYRPRGGSDASSQVIPNVDSSLSKYASTCSSESATNSFEVRTFPAGGEADEAAGPIRRARPRPEHLSHHYLHHHHPSYHHHNHPLLADDALHAKTRHSGEARGGRQESMGSGSKRQRQLMQQPLAQRPARALCPSHERNNPRGGFSRPHRSLPPATPSPHSDSPTCQFLEQSNNSQYSSSTSSSCCGPDTNYEEVTRAEEEESSDSLSSTHSLPSDSSSSSSSPSVSLHKNCPDSSVAVPLDLSLFQSCYQNENVEDPVGSQDVTPDSAVVADIGDGWSFARATGVAAAPVATESRELEETLCPLQPPRPTPRGLLNKLRGSNFSLNGYAPLGTDDASLTPVRTPSASHQVSRSEALGITRGASSAVFRPSTAPVHPLPPTPNLHPTDRPAHNLHYNNDF